MLLIILSNLLMLMMILVILLYISQHLFVVIVDLLLTTLLLLFCYWYCFLIKTLFACFDMALLLLFSLMKLSLFFAWLLLWFLSFIASHYFCSVLWHIPRLLVVAIVVFVVICLSVCACACLCLCVCCCYCPFFIVIVTPCWFTHVVVSLSVIIDSCCCFLWSHSAVWLIVT